jgi:hypothetical protein
MEDFLYQCDYYNFTNLNKSGNEDEVDEDFSGFSNDTGTFHLLAGYYLEALEIAMNYLNATIGEDNWDITSLAIVQGIDIINYERNDSSIRNGHFYYEPEDIECPACAASSCVLDLILEFECLCGFKFRIADNHWTKIICPQCHEEILREEVIRDSVTGRLQIKKKGDEI